MKLLEEFDALFLDKLNTYLSKKKEDYSLVHTDAGKLIDILSEFMNRKSKHIRPAIFYYSFKNWNTIVPQTSIWKIALAIECVHALALIHDDIIDKSALRRSKATIHELYGTETAILVGDLALTMADELYMDVVTNLEIPIKQKDYLNRTFNSFKQETIIGEYLDLLKNDDIFAVMKLKTAQYTFEKPAIMGMLLAGVSQKHINEWSKLLLELGITFQIHDDFVGSFGQEEIIGKSTDSDIKEGKNTVFAKLFLERANRSDKNRFLSFFGTSKVSKADVTWFQVKSEEYGIITTIQHDIEKRIMRIRDQLVSMHDNENDFRILIEIVLHKISDFSFLKTDSIDNRPTAGL